MVFLSKFSKEAFTSSLFLTSKVIKVISTLHVLFISFLTSSNLFSLRPTSTKSSPKFAKSMANCFPIPALAPVIKAVLFLI